LKKKSCAGLGGKKNKWNHGEKGGGRTSSEKKDFSLISRCFGKGGFRQLPGGSRGKGAALQKLNKQKRKYIRSTTTNKNPPVQKVLTRVEKSVTKKSSARREKYLLNAHKGKNYRLAYHRKNTKKKLLATKRSENPKTVSLGFGTKGKEKIVQRRHGGKSNSFSRRWKERTIDSY